MEVALRNGMVHVRLVDDALWNEFHTMRNEMIITKSGRCLFPILRYHVEGVLERHQYAFGIGMVRMDRVRWKFKTDAWHAGSREQASLAHSFLSRVPIDGPMTPEFLVPQMHVYEPAESPMSGKNLVQRGISLGKVKLTNQIGEAFASSMSRHRRQEHVFALQSFCRYQPVLITADVSALNACGQTLHSLPVHIRALWENGVLQMHRIESTQFIAVTHYQNERVTELKKAFNPHAKGFLNAVANQTTMLNTIASDGELAECEYIASQALEKLSRGVSAVTSCASSRRTSPPLTSPPQKCAQKRVSPKKMAGSPSNLAVWTWHQCA